jgi:hypothetical protein
MNPLLLCNLSNDMALASNVVPYAPPLRIQRMEHDLAMLAELWDDGSKRPQPWGWSRAAKAVFLKRGVDACLLPSDAQLDDWRILSSREFAVSYLKAFLSACPSVPCVGNQMFFLHSIEELHSLPVPMIFKSPWSSSGRGVFVAERVDEKVNQRLQGIVRRQGGFVVDEFYTEKHLDFAMEFDITQNGDVSFLGYSVFETGTQGNYGYNLVDSQSNLQQLIEETAGFSMDVLKQQHECLLREQLVGRYWGPLGIDMMVVKLPDGLAVHPCVEVNLRLNMGILAILLEQKADDPVFYRRLRERLPFESFPFSDFDCLRSCMRSSMRVPLTPSREVGFQAFIMSGKLMISCSS